MDSQNGQVDEWMDRWNSDAKKVTWELHFPLELLLPSPFGSSVGKPDLGEAGDRVSGCVF